MTAHAQLKALQDKYAVLERELNPKSDREWDVGKYYGTQVLLNQILEDLEACLAEHEGA